MSDHLQVVAAEDVRVGDPNQHGRFIGYDRLPRGKTEGADFVIPTKVEGKTVVEGVGYVRRAEPTSVPNDRFYRRMIRQGALKLFRPASASSTSKGSKGSGRGSDDSGKGQV